MNQKDYDKICFAIQQLYSAEEANNLISKFAQVVSKLQTLEQAIQQSKDENVKEEQK